MICVAESQGQARYRLMKASEIIYDDISWGAIKVKRAPEYDEWAKKEKNAYRNVSEEMLRKELGLDAKIPEETVG